MSEGRLSPDHATAIAQALGTWTFVPRTDDRDDLLGNRCALVYSGPEALLSGARLDLTVDGYRHQGQVHCSANLHHGPDPERIYLGRYLDTAEKNALVTSINCAESKTDAQIARDIARRLLPSYLPAYQTGRQRLDLDRCGQAMKEQEAETLARILGCARVTHGGLDAESVVYPGSRLPTLRVSQGSVRAEYFSMTYAQARLLAQLMGSDAWRSAAGV